MKNVWYEYKNMKEAFPVGCEVVLRLQPIEDYFEMIWAADSQGIVTGYNIAMSLITVAFENGVVMQCGAMLLEKVTSLIDGFEF